jgi:ferritin-like metal-binding protein YciE
MALFTKEIQSMGDLFLHVLQDVYYAEKQIIKSLPKMIDSTTNRELKSALKNHLQETENQVARLEQAFELIGERPKAASCPAIDGILKEANKLVGEIKGKKVVDAAILAAAQAVEHYEITRYGTLISWAGELGHDAAAKLLKATLREEKAADKTLTGIGENRVNTKAKAAA